MSVFDVLAAAHRLEQAGMNRRQAEAIIETARDAAAAGEPATRADLAATAADLKTEMAEFKAEIKAEILTHKAETLKWTIGAGGVYAGLIIAAVKLIPGP